MPAPATTTGSNVGHCVKCKRTYVWTEVLGQRPDTTFPVYYDTARPWCDCRAPDYPQTYVNSRPIKARRSDKACDSRCITAIGAMCVCSCRGRNHGASHRP